MVKTEKCAMLSLVVALDEMIEIDQESLSFVAFAMKDLDSIIITNGVSIQIVKDFFNRYRIDKEKSEIEEYKSFEEFFSAKAGQTNDWFLILTNKKLSNTVEGKQFVCCPYTFWGSMEQFVNKSFTEHAKKKLLYNELSWLYMESIANDTEQEVKFLQELFRTHNVKKVLDCCCGVGRHSYRLGEVGFLVTGIDASENQIATARVHNNSRNVKYYVDDARRFKLPEKYNAGICMWTTYNYFSKETDLVQFLNNMYDHLEKGGLLVLDSKNIPILDKKRLYHRRTQKDGIDLILLIYKRIFGTTQNSQYFYFINRDTDKKFYIDEEFVRFYSLEELEELNRNRFTLLKAYGDFYGNEYDAKKSQRMITVWKKSN